MRRTLMVTAVAVALAASGPAWAQDSEPAPGTTTDATSQSSTTSYPPVTSEMPATSSPLALLAVGGVLAVLAGARLARRGS